MTINVQSTDINISTGALFTAAEPSEIYWLTAGTLASSGQYGVDSNYVNFTARIDGQLFAYVQAIVGPDYTAVFVGNAGSVTCLTIAVFLNGESQVQNLGQIVSIDEYGVLASIDSAKVGSNFIANSGSIFGAEGGVVLGAGGGSQDILTNSGSISAGIGQFTGTIYGHGVLIEGNLSTVTNSGSISAAAYLGSGIDFYGGSGAGSSITNLAGGVIQSAQFWGIDALAVTAGTIFVTNHGTVEGDTGGLAGAFRGGAGGINLNNDGTLIGAVQLGTGAALFVNHGVADGYVTGTGTSDTLRNYGTITGPVYFGGGTSLIFNHGTIDQNITLPFGTYRGAAGHALGLITGGAGDNLIIGGSDDDTMLGGLGNDSLQGGAGDDQITGGAGTDILTGGAGADTFIYTSTAEIGKATASRDQITDFTPGTDHIDLTFFKTPGSFIGSGPFGHHAGEIQYDGATGLLSGDMNGDGAADWIIHLGTGLALTSADVLF